MRKLIFLAACVLLVTAGCKHPTTFKEVQIPGKFTMQVPDYLKASTDFADPAKACLQYESDSLKVYLLVFDTARQNLSEANLQTYYDTVAPREGEAGAHINSPLHTMINGDSAIVTEMDATINGIPTYHMFETIATPTRFYYVMAWCPKVKRDTYKEDIKKALYSFTDLNHKKV